MVNQLQFLLFSCSFPFLIFCLFSVFLGSPSSLLFWLLLPLCAHQFDGWGFPIFADLLHAFITGCSNAKYVGLLVCIGCICVRGIFETGHSWYTQWEISIRNPNCWNKAKELLSTSTGQEGWVSYLILKLAKLSVILCSFNANCQTLNEKLIIVVQVWEGQGVIKYGRKLIGATSPQASEPGTIRGDLCVQVSRLVPFKFRLLFTSLQL